MSSQKKVGLCISMYNECDTVLKSLTNMFDYYKDNLFSVVVHSEAKVDTTAIKALANKFFVLPNLVSILEWHEICANALSRNYSLAFSELYNTGDTYRFIVAMCGDTLITDPSNFERLYTSMCAENRVGYVAQAIGQDFHAADADPVNGKCGGRFQTDKTTDILPQLMFFDGSFAYKSKAFAGIPVVNNFTSEQCLGDELLRYVGSVDRFHQLIGRLNKNQPTYCYAYKDGVKYHARSGIPGR